MPPTSRSTYIAILLSTLLSTLRCHTIAESFLERRLGQVHLNVTRRYLEQHALIIITQHRQPPPSSGLTHNLFAILNQKENIIFAMFILRPVVIRQGMSMNNILFLITAVTFQTLYIGLYSTV